MIKKIYALIDKRSKKRIAYFQCFSIFQGLLEIVGVVSVLPLMFIVTANEKKEIFLKFPILENLFSSFTFKETQMIIVLLFVIYIIFINLFSIFNFIISEKILHKIYLGIFSNLINFYLLFSNKSHSGATNSERINNLTYNLNFSIIHIFRNIIRLFPKIYSLIFMIIAMLIIDFERSIIFILFFFISYFFIFKRLKKSLYLFGEQSSKENRNIIKYVKEVFDNLKNIHIDKLHDFFRLKLFKVADNYSVTVKRLQVFTFFIRIIIETIATLSLCFLMIYLLLKETDQIIPILSFYLYAFYRAFPAMQQIFATITSLKAWSYLIGNLLQFKTHKIEEDNYGNENIFFEKNISCNKIAFKYHNDSREIFKNINATIKKGTIFGIKGQSGSGKTTFVEIITGLKLPSSGTIEIDGKNLEKKNLLNWFKKISYVSQRIFLFNDTITNNIIFYSGKNSDQNHLKNIINAAELDKTIETKTNKLNEIVLESEKNLSGGEIQRLGIARALYKKPELLILDETTSGLELDMEEQILKNIKKIFPKITIILISHREKSLKICDEVLTFD